MSRKKDETILDLPQPVPDMPIGYGGELVSLSDGHFSLADRRRILQESQRQRMAMEAYAAKTHYGISMLARINRHASTTLFETADFIMDTAKEADGTEAQPYIEACSRHITEVMAQQIVRAATVGGSVITQEIARSPIPQEEEPRGFLKRLFR